MKLSLGKGLASLIPQKSNQKQKISKIQTKAPDIWLGSEKESIFNVEIDKIRPNPCQPRGDISPESLKELADSIREHGVLQPLIVSKIEKTTERGREVEYELVAGERRWRASKIAGLPHVPVIIRGTTTEHQKLELALVENIQRENLNAIETALAYKQLHGDFGLTHEEIAKRVGKSRVAVTNAIRLLTLPKEIQNTIKDGKLSEAHGIAILTARPDARMDIFRKALERGMAAHETWEVARAQASLVDKERRGGTKLKNKLFDKLSYEIRTALGGYRTVITERSASGGQLSIYFKDRGELEDLVKKILKQ